MTSRDTESAERRSLGLSRIPQKRRTEAELLADTYRSLLDVDEISTRALGKLDGQTEQLKTITEESDIVSNNLDLSARLLPGFRRWGFRRWFSSLSSKGTRNQTASAAPTRVQQSRGVSPSRRSASTRDQTASAARTRVQQSRGASLSRRSARTRTQTVSAAPTRAQQSRGVSLSRRSARTRNQTASAAPTRVQQSRGVSLSRRSAKTPPVPVDAASRRLSAPAISRSTRIPMPKPSKLESDDVYDKIDNLLNGLEWKSRDMSRVIDDHNRIIPEIQTTVEKNMEKMDKQSTEMRKMTGRLKGHGPAVTTNPAPKSSSAPKTKPASTTNRA